MERRSKAGSELTNGRRRKTREPKHCNAPKAPERVMTGLARARAEGKQLGRRTVEQSHGAKVKAALKLRSRGIGIRRIAREVGLGVGAVIRLVGNDSEAHPA
jgi:hypothetical protein